ncbi:HTH-type transcriptional activator RhaS [Grimontia celer]|uniref:HTH-type transcriptional activator RhaS n=1 Tax=Grimontia celer TaxID=1796497 RepID=A0A128F8W8_9GAMM|nr:AraC family transcriptional regulator [Grimontia celer]CZF82945.1 HTH-type transcriptional activator RhaS [Grimontia celer]
MELGRRPRQKPTKVALAEKIELTEKQMIVSKNRGQSKALLEGNFVAYQYGDGIAMHGGTSMELHDSNIVSSAPSSLILTLLLEGQLSFGYDELQFELDANVTPKAVLVNLARPAHFRRAIRKGNPVRKINVMFKPDWVRERADKHSEMLRLLSTHQAHIKIHVNEKVLTIANKLVEAGTPETFGEKLAVESLIHQLALHVLSELEMSEMQTGENAVSETARRLDPTVENIVGYIETQLQQPLTLESLASEFAISVSKLQRLFKANLDLTVQGYVRQRRLEIARQQLERGLVGITEAAYEAGYQHPSNFTAAFRREFGVSPKALLSKK